MDNTVMRVRQVLNIPLSCNENHDGDGDPYIV
jgi:hypothetical protein